MNLQGITVSSTQGEREGYLYRIREGGDGVRRAGLMKTAMAPLLEWAELLVPEDRWAATPLFLFGTAGTRQLPEKDRVRLLDHLNDILNASSFRSLTRRNPSIPFTPQPTEPVL